MTNTATTQAKLPVLDRLALEHIISVIRATGDLDCSDLGQLLAGEWLDDDEATVYVEVHGNTRGYEDGEAWGSRLELLVDDGTGRNEMRALLLDDEDVDLDADMVEAALRANAGTVLRQVRTVAARRH